MRRFTAYLIMLITVIGALIFNTQSVLENKVDAMEFGSGTQIVYSLTKRDATLFPEKNYPDLTAEDLTNIDIEGKVMERLDTAGVRNTNVQVVKGENNIGYQLRIAFSPLSDKELSNVKEVVSKTGTLSVCTINDECMYASASQFFDNDNLAEVTYNGTTPYPTLNIKDSTDFDSMKKKAEEASPSTGTDENGEATANDDAKTLYLWVNKSSDDTYAKAFGKDETVVQQAVKDKVIAKLSTDNYSTENKTLSITSDMSGNAFDISSARAFVNMLNADDYGFECTYLYENTLPASFGFAGINNVYLSVGIALLVICILLIAFYGLAGITGAVSMVGTVFLTFLFFSLMGFEFSVGAIVGMFVVIALSGFISVNYFEHVKQELKKDREIEKANREGYHKAFFGNLDASLVALFASLFSFLCAQGQFRIFFGVVVIGTIIAFLLTQYTDKWMIYWLTKDAKPGLPFFAFSKKDYKEPKTVSFCSEDKKSKKNKTPFFILAFTAILLAVTIPVTNAVGGNGYSIFNNGGNYQESYTLTIQFNTNIQAYNALSTKAYYLDYIKTIGKESNPTYTAYASGSTPENAAYSFAYDEDSAFLNSIEKKDEEGDVYFINCFSVTVDRNLNKLTLSNGSDTPVTLIQDAIVSGEFTVDDTFVAPGSDSHYEDDTLSMGCYAALPTNVAHDTNNFLLVVFLLGVFAMLYVFVRYGISLSLAGLASTTVLSGLAVGLLSATRVPYNAYTAFGILAAVLIASFLIVPLLAGNKQTLKERGIKKTATYAERAEIANQTATRNMVIITLPTLFTAILSLSLLAINTALLPTSLCLIVLAVLNLVLNYFFTVPTYHFFASHISFKKITGFFAAWHKKRHPDEKERKADKNGVVYVDEDSPHETVIVGLNEFIHR